MSSTEILAELSAREPIFHRPAFARTRDAFDRLMAPDYWEIGASGTRYDRAFILDHLQRNPPVDAGAAGWLTFAHALPPPPPPGRAPPPPRPPLATPPLWLADSLPPGHHHRRRRGPKKLDTPCIM